ncbi:MAG: hypothetical protein AB7L09_21220 [Nitrospira sp.]
MAKTETTMGSPPAAKVPAKPTLAERRAMAAQRQKDLAATAKDLEFKSYLEENKITIEAFIQRSPRDWYPHLYVFRFKKGTSDWSRPLYVVWNDTTFDEVIKAIGSK